MSIFRSSLLKFIEAINPSGDLIFLLFRLRGGGAITFPSLTMSGNELNEYFHRNAFNKNILEFGSGGSTIYFAEIGKQVTSIESDRLFSKKMQSHIRILQLEHKVAIFWTNIGPTKSYGQPWRVLKLFYRKRYPSYFSQVFNTFENVKDVDFVFVDGRFRVACSMAVLLNIEKDFTLVIDDFFDRPEYSAILDVLINPNLKVGNTAIFEVNRASLDFALIKTILLKYSNDPR